MTYYSQSKVLFYIGEYSEQTYNGGVGGVVKNVNMLVMNKKWVYEGSNDNLLGFSNR